MILENSVSLDTACPILAISSSPDHQPSEESTVGFIWAKSYKQAWVWSMQEWLPCLVIPGFFWSPEMLHSLFGNGRIGKKEPILLNSWDNRCRNHISKPLVYLAFSVIQEHHWDPGNKQKMPPSSQNSNHKGYKSELIYLSHRAWPLRPLALRTVLPLI